MSEPSGSASCQVGSMFSFDGASRDNLGNTAAGVCAWWRYFYIPGRGSFKSKGLRAQKGICLGTSINNMAETHGMASALKMCLRHYGVVIEHFAEERSMNSSTSTAFPDHGNHIS